MTKMAKLKPITSGGENRHRGSEAAKKSVKKR
jgi:hypothetical protein